MSELMLITVKNQFEGEHYYPDAPNEVSYLRNPHRHIFYVESEVEVFHDDRELEFIMVKHEIAKFLNSKHHLKNQSCEMIAREIKSFLKIRYPIPNANVYVNRQIKTERIVNIKVFEDNENGVYLREV